jgi:polyketide biosynthesis enoyl-CoA hydratase PksI
MQDRANKNSFSSQLMEGLFTAFRTVSARDDARAVILTGYDSYFASGGTREALLDFNAGRGTFADRDIYALALECPVPVVSAMQGHAIGGGFALGIFSDICILGRESIYTANFMKYGFTPGMGATLILPYKLGPVLGSEMMYTAKTYRGEELQKRGCPFPVLPAKEVIGYAYEMAQSIADKPRPSLIALKAHLSEHMRTALPSIIEKEIAMHETTFHLPEVKGRIQALFGN